MTRVNVLVPRLVLLAGLMVGVLSGTGTAAQLQPLADLMVDSINDLPEQPAFGKRGWRLFA